MRTLPIHLIVMTLLSALIVGAPARAQDSPPLAVLMAVQGNVTVQAADGSTRAAGFGMHLHPGDTVQTGDDASAEILFSSGNLVQIGANSRTGVGQPRANPAARNESFDSVQDFLKLKDARGTSSVGTLRSSGNRKGLSLVQPCQTRVAVDQLRFRWKGDEADSELKLTVYGDESVVYETQLHGTTELAYPDDAPALSSGVSYSWTVETTDPLVIPPLRSAVGFFELIGEDEQQKLDKQLEAVESGQSSESSHLYRASIYYRYGMLDRAVEETTAALESDPANDDLRSILARLLNEAGRSAEAVNEYDRLLAPR